MEKRKLFTILYVKNNKQTKKSEIEQIYSGVVDR